MSGDRWISCRGCEVRVNPRQAGAAELVQGWRVNRAGGGANQIREWKGLGRWLCPACVIARQSGLDPAQPSLGSW